MDTLITIWAGIVVIGYITVNLTSTYDAGEHKLVYVGCVIDSAIMVYLIFFWKLGGN